tara:strand:+ start:8127 stop:8528 length:402 start_codon:yes stop_codon:yes gene_type:complete
MMKTFKTALLLAALAAGPALAQGYVPNERLTYTPTENGVRISGSTGFGARGHWCAAAGYAVDQMGAADRQTLYVSEPRARGFGGDGGVTFTLDPTGLTPSPVVILGGSLTKAGSAMTISHGITLCGGLQSPGR